MVGASGPVVHS